MLIPHRQKRTEAGACSANTLEERKGERAMGEEGAGSFREAGAANGQTGRQTEGAAREDTGHPGCRALQPAEEKRR